MNISDSQNFDSTKKSLSNPFPKAFSLNSLTTKTKREAKKYLKSRKLYTFSVVNIKHYGSMNIAWLRLRLPGLEATFCYRSRLFLLFVRFIKGAMENFSFIYLISRLQTFLMSLEGIYVGAVLFHFVCLFRISFSQPRW